MGEFDRLAIEAACIRLAHAFCRYSDSNDVARYEALFTRDAIFARPGLKLKGAAAIGANLGTRPDRLVVRHLSTNAMVDISGRGEATGTGTLLVIREDREAAAREGPLFVDYRDVYRLTEQGWQIARRDVAVAI